MVMKPNHLHPKLVLVAALVLSLPAAALTGQAITNDSTLAEVAVNGGTDTLNPGTTCIKLTEPVTPSCPAGFLYIPNNNRQLVSAALMAKASNSRVAVYYISNAATGHCPGHVFTQCSVVSIFVR
jgi:uncharacterized membrane-anchored protein